MTNCRKHPRYKGIRAPSASCKECIRIFYEVRGFEEMMSCAGFMSNVLFNIAQDKDVPESWRNIAKTRHTYFDDAMKDFRRRLIDNYDDKYSI